MCFTLQVILTLLVRDGHARILLTRLLTSGSKVRPFYLSSYRIVTLIKIKAIRKSVVGYLGYLTTQSKSYVKWTINMLVSQMYDSDTEVSRFSILILDNLCQRDESIAREIVKCRPIFINVMESAFSLMTRLLAVPSGFDFLSKLTFIESQLIEWNKVDFFF